MPSPPILLPSLLSLAPDSHNRPSVYNSLPCSGQGECVGGVCACIPGYSGDLCDMRASFSRRLINKISSVTFLLALSIFLASVAAHALAWFVITGMYNIEVRGGVAERRWRVAEEGNKTGGQG
eukprot:765278-Hanusia_phi.AAC.5